MNLNLYYLCSMKQRSWVNQYIELSEEYPDMLASLSGENYPADALTEFKRKRELHSELFVEIGSGSGGHLLEQASKAPDSLWVGFELRYKRAVRTVQKAKQLHKIDNVFVFRGPAEEINEIIPAGVVDGAYVNFPDPWAKKKWRKHRILSAEYLLTLHSLLTQDGFLSFKTDHREYFDFARENIEKSRLFEVEQLSLDLHSSELSADNVYTEFEMLFKNKGLPVHWLSARKIRRV